MSSEKYRGGVMSMRVALLVLAVVPCLVGEVIAENAGDLKAEEAWRRHGFTDAQWGSVRAARWSKQIYRVVLKAPIPTLPGAWFRRSTTLGG